MAANAWAGGESEEDNEEANGDAAANAWADNIADEGDGPSQLQDGHVDSITPSRITLPSHPYTALILDLPDQWFADEEDDELEYSEELEKLMLCD
ncbi:hypothetical protein M413DRAFT_135030 [Hebeloma cylindrosporum]|nr:hypothetical protein M413DRAFT_135030 [Hebeloma cylindrosporum h7]